MGQLKCPMTITYKTSWTLKGDWSKLAQKDNVLQPEGDVTATEGDAVTLGCLYNSSSTNNYLYWYKQDGNNSPTFILNRVKLDEGNTPDEYRERFSSTLNSTSRSVPLKIQKLQLSDSAVYYCALYSSMCQEDVKDIGGNH
uniref:Ig-like domain-containing protein n=1 Tax=Mastacembelus armatus TaxID=205130 RepID=A0A7N8WYL7_9TELE